MKDASHKRLYAVSLHLYEMSRTSKSRGIERLVVLKSLWEVDNKKIREMPIKYVVSFGSDENVLKL